VAWLQQWSRLAARRRSFRQEDADRYVLAPAARLRGDGSGYVEYLNELCARAVGSTCPFVPVHGDLTATNILVDAGRSLGVLDWESASEEGLPMTDFFYAAADAVAAAGGYLDRPRSVVSCFALDGDRARFTRRLAAELAGAVGVDEVVRELCFHACWLHHASNEACRGASDIERPFGAILRILAENPARFRFASR
jgi:aminoglycoside phosphotransferase (APT) family kinase protein